MEFYTISLSQEEISGKPFWRYSRESMILEEVDFFQIGGNGRPYWSYNLKDIFGAYASHGVQGLNGLKLSDSDILRALRNDCIREKDLARRDRTIVDVLEGAGWDKKRLISAHEEYGLNKGYIAHMASLFDNPSNDALAWKYPKRA